MSSTSTGSPTAPSGRETWRLVLFAALTAAIGVAALWTPSDRGLPSCLLKLQTGMSCPGCGMTRAVCALGHGDVSGALRYHAFAPLVAAAALYAWGALGVGLVTGRAFLPAPSGRLAGIGALVFTGAFLAYWLVRVVTKTAP